MALVTLTRTLAAACGALNYTNGFHRPFPLTDASVAFPSKADMVLIPVVVVVALVIPAAIITVFNLSAVLLFHDRTDKYRFRRMLWEHPRWRARSMHRPRYHTLRDVGIERYGRETQA